jgi:hypothetical protein
LNFTEKNRRPVLLNTEKGRCFMSLILASGIENGERALAPSVVLCATFVIRND